MEYRTQLSHDAIAESFARRSTLPISVTVVDSLSSTNTEMVKTLAKQLRSGAQGKGAQVNSAQGNSAQGSGAPAVLVARHQTAGKGRAGREWITAEGGALTFSIHLEVDVPLERATWLPLIVGNAISEVLMRDLEVPALVKWPNDILLRTDQPDIPQWLGLRKLGGILVERVNERNFVVGIGLNVGQDIKALPVDTAVSLRSAGYGEVDGNELLSAIVFEVIAQVSDWEKHAGDPDMSGVRALAEEFSVTIGSHVSVEFPTKESLTGDAIGFGDSGELLIRKENGECFAFSAGDVSHLRLR